MCVKEDHIPIGAKYASQLFEIENLCYFQNFRGMILGVLIFMRFVGKFRCATNLTLLLRGILNLLVLWTVPASPFHVAFEVIVNFEHQSIQVMSFFHIGIIIIFTYQIRSHYHRLASISALGSNQSGIPWRREGLQAY